MGCAVILPFPPNIIELPDNMTPEEQATLVRELGEITKESVKLRTQLEERGKFNEQRFRGIDARLAKLERQIENLIEKLERSADTSSNHDVSTLQKALDKAHEQADKWKWWAMSIIGVLITSGITGAVVHYLSR